MLHEFGHAVMAQHFGIRVHDITLVPIGGIARIEENPSTARSEILIALAGPAVNVVIAVTLAPVLILLGLIQGFGSFGAYLSDPSITAPGGLLLYLVVTNIMLVLFNLLPAFPLDGGRVLRASLLRHADRERATAIAVVIAQILAVGLAATGVWFKDFGLPVIAVFILVGAWAENRAVRVEAAMHRLRVGQFALWDHGGIAPDQSLNRALTGGPRDQVVTVEGTVVGMLWRQTLLHGLNGGAGNRRISDLMDAGIPTVDVAESLYSVQKLMNESNRWAIAVTEDGFYRGIFTAERFAHIYRQLTTPPETHIATTGFVGSVQAALRGFMR
ncbi:MAG: peptidase M50 [Propionibacteriaceae bacterium]|nr:peptidase M50 [Propionibacteriaceae bacterium]